MSKRRSGFKNDQRAYNYYFAPPPPQPHQYVEL